MEKTQSFKFEIEKFNGSNNFELWKVKMRDMLIQQGTEKALVGKTKKPYDMSNEDWNEIDEKDLSVIRLCLVDDVLFNIVSETTAVGLWTKLESLYMTKSLTNKILLKRQLFTLRMKEGTKISDHLNAFNTLVCQLSSMEDIISSEDKAILMLCSLPESWAHFVTSISLSSVESISFDEIVGAMISEETRKKSSLETSTSEVMIARGRSTERGQHSKDSARSKSKGKKSKLKCWFCNKSGHLKKDCWKRKEASKDQDSTKEANLAEEDSGMVDEVLSTSNVSQYHYDWLIDSGASHHMCLHRNWFSTYQSIDDGVVYMGNDVTCKTVGIGSIRIRMFDGIVRTLTDVRHVPDLRKNLISLGVLDSSGHKGSVQGGVLKISKGILIVMKANKVGNLYKLEGRTEIDHAGVASENAGEFTRLWHQRLGHISERGMKVLADRKLLPSLKTVDLKFCEHCVYGKQARQKFKTGKHTSKGILDYIHSDLWGPAPKLSYGGSLYFVSFIDDYSRKVWIYLLKKKADVFNTFKQFRDLVEKSTGKSIKCLRTDNGGEFTSKEFENYCKNEGIDRHKTTVYTPQQNGVAERMNRTLLERVRSMLSNAKLQQELWGEALFTSCYLVNRSPSTAIDCKIPEEVWTGQPCNYSSLRVFGCDAYALIPKSQRSKLDPKSQKLVFVGYGDGVKGYRLWNPTAHKIIINRDVIFDETSLMKSDGKNVLKQVDVPQSQQVQFDIHSSTGENHGDVHEQDIHEQITQQDEQTETPQEIEVIPQQALRRSTRIKSIPSRYDDFVTSVALITNEGEPSCYSEAIEVSDSDKWKHAMKEEIDALIKNKTWDLVELPKNRRVVGCKWIYKLKKGADNVITKYKARLVAKGFSQEAGIDFHEIFSPVVKIVSIRMVLALVALHNLELEQLDVKTAFLHGDLDEEIYMEQPEGFVQDRNKRFVCKLKKSLYGLKQIQDNGTRSLIPSW